MRQHASYKKCPGLLRRKLLAKTEFGSFYYTRELCDKSSVIHPHIPLSPPLTPTAPSPILPLQQRAKGVKAHAQIPQDAMAAEDYGYAAAAQG